MSVRVSPSMFVTSATTCAFLWLRQTLLTATGLPHEFTATFSAEPFGELVVMVAEEAPQPGPDSRANYNFTRLIPNTMRSRLPEKMQSVLRRFADLRSAVRQWRSVRARGEATALLQEFDFSEYRHRETYRFVGSAGPLLYEKLQGVASAMDAFSEYLAQQFASEDLEIKSALRKAFMRLEGEVLYYILAEQPIEDGARSMYLEYDALMVAAELVRIKPADRGAQEMNERRIEYRRRRPE